MPPSTFYLLFWGVSAHDRWALMGFFAKVASMGNVSPGLSVALMKSAEICFVGYTVVRSCVASIATATMGLQDFLPIPQHIAPSRAHLELSFVLGASQHGYQRGYVQGRVKVWDAGHRASLSHGALGAAVSSVSSYMASLPNRWLGASLTSSAQPFTTVPLSMAPLPPSQVHCCAARPVSFPISQPRATEPTSCP